MTNLLHLVCYVYIIYSSCPLWLLADNVYYILEYCSFFLSSSSSFLFFFYWWFVAVAVAVVTDLLNSTNKHGHCCMSVSVFTATARCISIALLEAWQMRQTWYAQVPFLLLSMGWRCTLLCLHPRVPKFQSRHGTILFCVLISASLKGCLAFAKSIILL